MYLFFVAKLWWHYGNDKFTYMMQQNFGSITVILLIMMCQLLLNTYINSSLSGGTHFDFISPSFFRIVSAIRVMVCVVNKKSANPKVEFFNNFMEDTPELTNGKHRSLYH